MTKYFGTSGIRGEVGKDINCELAFKLGVALSKYRTNPRVVIARDTRPSGGILSHSVSLGILSMGGTILDIGVCPTAGVSFLTKVLNADFGVVVTASHNINIFNGFKIFNKAGEELCIAEEEEIERFMLEPITLDYSKAGEYYTCPENVEIYAEFLENVTSVTLDGLKIVLDNANGAGSAVTERVFKNLGAEVVSISNNPSGVFINEGVGALHPELLVQRVLEENADCGFAYDGDADRVIVVSKSGRVYDGDTIMYVLANYLHSLGKLKQNLIVCTTLSNGGILNQLKTRGVGAIISSVGDRNVSEKMAEIGANLGGEVSGHIILSDYQSVSDGILASLILAEVLKITGEKLDILMDAETLPQKTINCATNFGDEIIESYELKAVINSVSASLGDFGRVVVRKSGTEKVIRVMVESESLSLSTLYAETIAKVILELNKIHQKGQI